jgi:hypothetical protein
MHCMMQHFSKIESRWACAMVGSAVKLPALAYTLVTSAPRISQSGCSLWFQKLRGTR